MKIAAGSLFLGLFLFLHSVDLISSTSRAEQTTLWELFPQSQGVQFPPIKKLDHTTVQSFRKFQKLNGSPMSRSAATYLQRGDVIFGCLDGDEIKLLGPLFGELHLFAVFNTKNQEWYTLSYPELEKLGVSRSLVLVQAHDEAALVARSRYGQANPHAHYAASEAAYRPTKNHEETLRALQTARMTSQEYSIRSVKELYHREYNEAYQRHA